MEAVLSNPKVFKDMVDVISQIIDEGVFTFSESGLEFLAPDRATVAVIHARIPASSFESYTCSGEEKVGLNIPAFLTVLKRASGKLGLRTEGDRLEVTIYGASTRKFSLPILEINQEVPPVSKFQFSASLTVASRILEEGINDADIVGDSVVFELSGEKFVMRAEGPTSSVEITAEKGAGLSSISGEARARYPLDYLKKFVKALRMAENTRVQLSTDYPVKLEVERNDAYISLILAPRVEE